MYHILDTETAGFSGGVVELAYLRVDSALNVLESFVSRCNPQRKIDAGAYAVHGISDKDVASAPTLAELALRLPERIDMIAHNCVTGDHEVLTPAGWKRFDALQGSTEAAVWNVDGTIEFESCALVHKDYSGDLICYNSLFHTGRYTPDHRVYYSRASKLLDSGLASWEVSSAREYSRLGLNSTVIPTAGVLSGVSGLPLSLMEIRLLEAIRADANIGSGRNLVKWNLVKPRKIERLRHLLLACGVPFSEKLDSRPGAKKPVARFGLLDCDFRRVAIEILCREGAKQLGSWVLELSTEQREVLLDEISYWDGRYVPPTDRKAKQIVLTTANRSEAEWVQILSVVTGRCSAVFLDMPNTRGFSRSDGKLSKVTIRKNPYAKTINPSHRESFNGIVYCLTTSTGAFLVRRGGKVWVTGNCSFDSRMIHPHISVGRSLCTLALSRTHIKGTSNHKLSTLRTELKLPEQKDHSALGDVYTTLALLKYIVDLTGVTVETHFQRLNKPRMLSEMPFGKFKGVPMLDVPADYRKWLINQDIDRDLKYTLERLEAV